MNSTHLKQDVNDALDAMIKELTPILEATKHTSIEPKIETVIRHNSYKCRAYAAAKVTFHVGGTSD